MKVNKNNRFSSLNNKGTGIKAVRSHCCVCEQAAVPLRSSRGQRCSHCISFRMSGMNSWAFLSASFHSCGMTSPPYDPPAPSRAPSAAPRLQFSPGTQILTNACSTEPDDQTECPFCCLLTSSKLPPQLVFARIPPLGSS